MWALGKVWHPSYIFDFVSMLRINICPHHRVAMQAKLVIYVKDNNLRFDDG
jgi:hypothetical protein